MEIGKSMIKNLPSEKYMALLPDFKEKRNQEFTTLILTLFALILFGIFAINPTLSTIFQLRKQLEDNHIVDQKLDEKIARLSILQQQYTLLSNDIPVVLHAIPTTASLTILLGQFQSLAQANDLSGLRIQTSGVNLTPGKQIAVSSGEGKNYSMLTFTLSVGGSTNNIMSFFKALVNFDRIVTLDTVSITQAQDATSSQLVVSGKAYYKQ